MLCIAFGIDEVKYYNSARFRVVWGFFVNMLVTLL